MKLKKLKLTNFRNFKNFEIKFNEKLNVIVAENGIGKTTILDAIAIGYGAMLTRFPKVKGKTFEESDLRFDNQNRLSPYMRVELETYNNIFWDRTQARNKSTETKKLIPKAKWLIQLHNYIDSVVDKEYSEIVEEYEIPLIMYYGTNRAVLKTPMRKRNFKKEFSRYEALEGAINSDTNFSRLFQWFDAMQSEENQQIKERRDFDYKLPELEAVRNVIEIMLPQMKNPRIITRPLRFVINKVIEDKEVSFRIDQLSDGYKIVLAMVIDISARMAEANPHLKEESNKSKALIMIDEVDLHLHPKWQQTILIDLQKAFPNAQFIVTTHSSQVLTTAEPQSIQRLFLKDDQVEFEPFDFSFGAKSHELLNKILKINERPQNLEIVQKLNRYMKLINENLYNKEEARILREELDAWGGGKEKTLLKADMDIKLKEYQRKKYEKN